MKTENKIQFILVVYTIFFATILIVNLIKYL